MYPLNPTSSLPQRFPSPFNNQPHAQAVAAARDLQQRLPAMTDRLHDFHVDGGGKMLGVLVVKDEGGKSGYLAGFSGMLGGCWTVSGFVPPVFDESIFVPLLEQGDHDIRAMDAEADALKQSPANVTAYENKISCDARVERELAGLLLKQSERRQSRHAAREQHPNDSVLHSQLAQQSREDKKERQSLRAELRDLAGNADNELQKFKEQVNAIDRKRKRYSAQLQRKLFDLYLIASVDADAVPLRSLFPEALPPGGAGDCAAVKLLNAAIQQKLTPVCVAEFWWGKNAGLRQHGRFYPSCRSKCRRILPQMLKGLDVTVPAHECALSFPTDVPEVEFEDESIVVVNKPAGMLSVPGDAIKDSVEYRLRQRNPVTDNPTLLLHRLDQATSGLLLAAKNARCYKALQHQFQRRTVDKTYMAILDSTTLPDSGEITLPLRVDLEDRPRQMVCYSHGKQSLTRFKVTGVGQHTSAVEFKPVTGRTHQLRIHAAHPEGLNASIVGDELYGVPSDRLYLHAQTLAFTHPLTGERMIFSIPAPFLSEQGALK